MFLAALSYGGETNAWPLGGFTSNSVCCIVMRAHTGRFARCPATVPIENDFGCAFQVALSSGTSVSRRRVVAISWSNSGRRACAMLIGMDPLRGLESFACFFCFIAVFHD